MRCLRFLLFVSLFTLPVLASAQITGCYSQPSGGGLGRFYYQRISGNNYSASPYATSGAAISCTTFTSISVSTTACQVGGTSTAYLFLATANVPITCLPIDDYAWLFLPFTLGCVLVLRSRKPRDKRKLIF
ncbi:hypothetical protein GJU39_17495 [Pedobacter petrophilus]|uniref:Uncharacterized protein n=1 Tax=Pedobacter petrophilus TaxID=1908241 RepID=A0A7K0G3A0_9SPHI|nr:hypothetical protein [Pedobacter petrophilus]MRX77880.1 hypothetical protein [Pedobacter petrophilus]